VALPHAEVKHTLVDLAIDRCESCCRETLTWMSSGKAFRRYAGLDHDNYVVGSLGDSPKMATELADLVIAGIKRATASLIRDYSEGREPIPRPGDFVMMLDGERRPRFIWRTTEITIKPLSEVDAAFAWDEGEGDRTRDWWLAAHRRYFGRQATREGFEFDDNILTVFERFEGQCALGAR